MTIRLSHLFVAAALVLSASGVIAQDKATKEAAAKLNTDGNNNPDQNEGVKQLCKAASMIPKNEKYVSDCSAAKNAVIAGDKRSLTKAQDLADAGNTKSALRYAGQVGDLDAATHEKAQQLIARLSAPAATPQPEKPATPVHADNSSALLATANSNFESGNLQGAKAAAAQVTDPNLKALATRIVSDVDRYSGLIAEGQRNESGNPQAALNAYQSAKSISHSVAADGLDGKIARLQQQLVAVNHPPPPPPPANPGNPPANTGGKTPPVNQVKTPEPSPEDKKKQFLVAYNAAVGRNDAEGQERALRQLVQLDGRDADSRAKLDAVQKQIADQLNRDPAKLESTLKEAIVAFYASDLDSAESKLNNYLRASGAKKKGVAYFYLGATDEAQAFLQPSTKRASRLQDAKDNFRQARSAGYQPVQKYVSGRILEAWQQAGL